MSRYLLLLILSLCGVSGVCAAPGSPQEFLVRGRELFDFGRWSEARHEFLAARDALQPGQRADAEEIDFFLAACAVELGSTDAEGALLRFVSKYPAPRSTIESISPWVPIIAPTGSPSWPVRLSARPITSR